MSYSIALGNAHHTSTAPQIAEAVAEGCLIHHKAPLGVTFASFPFHPVAPVEDEDNQLEPCEPNNPNLVCWGVYGLYHDLGGELLCDCDGEEEASALVQALTKLTEDNAENRKAHTAYLLRTRYGLEMNDVQPYDSEAETPEEFCDRMEYKYDLDRIDINSLTGKRL